MRRIEVSTRDLLFALGSRMPDTNHYLDIQTGEVIPVFTFNRERVVALVRADPDRYVRIAPQSGRRGYEIMKQFVQTVSRPELNSLLRTALESSDAFSGFRQVLKAYPAELKRWKSFRTEMMVQGLRERLRERDVEFALVNDEP